VSLEATLEVGTRAALGFQTTGNTVDSVTLTIVDNGLMSLPPEAKTGGFTYHHKFLRVSRYDERRVIIQVQRGDTPDTVMCWFDSLVGTEIKMRRLELRKANCYLLRERDDRRSDHQASFEIPFSTIDRMSDKLLDYTSTVTN
jgi:hypothetical protein